jgi:hypothetical protein
MDNNLEYKNLQVNMNQNTRNENIEGHLSNNYAQEEAEYNPQYKMNNKPKIPMSYYFSQGEQPIYKQQMGKNINEEGRYLINEEMINNYGMVFNFYFILE